ncbi:MAG: hypothetical protein KGJ60_02485 [Verrucomicrobiota bacterium]|nr:hypothetical protein [Verrucomicrobiota bacterium]
MELAQANARILMEVYLSEKLPLPPLLRRVFKRKQIVEPSLARRFTRSRMRRLRWANTRGQKGHWSEMVSATIAG